MIIRGLKWYRRLIIFAIDKIVERCAQPITKKSNSKNSSKIVTANLIKDCLKSLILQKNLI